MDLSSHVDKVGRELAVAAQAGGDDARALAERLTAPLDSALRLTLLEALSTAADEITRELAPGSVELRLRGGEPDFVVTSPPQLPSPEPDGAEPAGGSDPAGAAIEAAAPTAEDAATARINFRLPEHLKSAIEEAAGRQGRSVNAWLMRAAAAALQPSEHHSYPERRGKRGSQRYTGWGR